MSPRGNGVKQTEKSSTFVLILFVYYNYILLSMMLYHLQVNPLYLQCLPGPADRPGCCPSRTQLQTGTEPGCAAPQRWSGPEGSHTGRWEAGGSESWEPPCPDPADPDCSPPRWTAGSLEGDAHTGNKITLNYICLFFSYSATTGTWVQLRIMLKLPEVGWLVSKCVLPSVNAKQCFCPQATWIIFLFSKFLTGLRNHNSGRIHYRDVMKIIIKALGVVVSLGSYLGTVVPSRHRTLPALVSSTTLSSPQLREWIFSLKSTFP